MRNVTTMRRWIALIALMLLALSPPQSVGAEEGLETHLKRFADREEAIAHFLYAPKARGRLDVADGRITVTAKGYAGPARVGSASGWFHACLSPPKRVIKTRWTNTPGSAAGFGHRAGPGK